jgi:hypothetical protein
LYAQHGRDATGTDQGHALADRGRLGNEFGISKKKALQADHVGTAVSKH